MSIAKTVVGNSFDNICWRFELFPLGSSGPAFSVARQERIFALVRKHVILSCEIMEIGISQG